MKNPIPSYDMSFRDTQKVYHEMLSIIDFLDEHRWSRSMTNYDAKAISEARNRLMEASNDLYLATHIEME